MKISHFSADIWCNALAEIGGVHATAVLHQLLEKHIKKQWNRIKQAAASSKDRLCNKSRQ